MKNLSLKEVELISHELASRLMKWDEPIPQFETRFPGSLESCLATPFQTFAKRKLYKGLIDKAAILFYLMVKNHPFQNGNKRIAMTTVLYFLYKNGKWIEVENQELYSFAKWVAASNPKVKDATVQAIADFIRQYILDLKK